MSGASAIGVFSIGASAIEGTGTERAPAFLVVEVEASKPGAATYTFDQGYGTRPRGALAQFPDQIISTGMIRVSDAGYRSASTDSIGIMSFPPHVSDALAIANGMNLSPAQSPVGAAWSASVRLSNASGAYDSIVASWNSDSRAVRVLAGTKRLDTYRAYLMDPPYATLTSIFTGMAAPWFLSETTLDIPLRDATYWLEQPFQTSLYGGAGAYDGAAALKNKPKPKARGGSITYPIRNVTPTLMDSTNRIYQYNDGPGTVVTFLEGGAGVFSFAGNTTDLYAGSTPAGQYRTDDGRGLFQLGSVPVHAITADVTGSFPVAGVVTLAGSLARYLLSEDAAMPAANIDTASFAAADAACPYVSGIYVGSDVTPTGIDIMNLALPGMGARLVSFRDGTMRLLLMRAIPAGAAPADTWTTTNVMGVIPRQLSADISPVPYRYRIKYNLNHTVQTSDINVATATAAQQQFMAGGGPVATWISAANQIAYRRPNDPPEIATALLALADAQAAADALGALFGTARRLYDVTVPRAVGIMREIGDIVSLVWPVESLATGRVGRIVGYDFKSTDSTIAFQVLV